jgi:hypothetical protein
VQQQRRAAPGWDGCRDRWDGRDKRPIRDFYSMPNEMVWYIPSQRANHRMAFHASLGLLVLYGGDSYEVDQLHYSNVTYPSTVTDDMWVYSIREWRRVIAV